jgi:hypothetical protein
MNDSDFNKYSESIFSPIPILGIGVFKFYMGCNQVLKAIFLVSLFDISPSKLRISSLFIIFKSKMSTYLVQRFFPQAA